MKKPNMTQPAQMRRERALVRLEGRLTKEVSPDWHQYVPHDMKGTAAGEKLGRLKLANALGYRAQQIDEANTLRRRLGLIQGA